MSLKGTAMTNKVLRGKIKDIHQIEDVEALYAEAEELIDSAKEVIKAEELLTSAEEATQRANSAALSVNEAIQNTYSAVENANSAVETAEEAAENANEAAENANEAAENANEAAENANTEAENAKFQAIYAEKMGYNASSAAARANEAAKVANALKGKVKGNGAIQIDDVSQATHEIGVKLSGFELVLIADSENFTGIEEGGNGLGFHIINEIYISDGDNVIYTENGSVNFWANDDFKGYGNSIKVGDTIYYDGTNKVYWQTTISDYSNITLTKYGKNLLNRNSTVVSNGTLTFEGNRQTFTSTSGGGDLKTVLGNYQDFVGKTITISYDFMAYQGRYTSFNTFLLADTTEIGRFAKAYKEGGVKGIATFTVPENDTAKELILRQYVGYVTTTGYDFITLDNLQVEIGKSATEYEEYKYPTTYTPNEDGTVDGVTSLSPTTTLIADIPNVTIEAEYNRDINKTIERLENAILSLGGNV